MKTRVLVLLILGVSLTPVAKAGVEVGVEFRYAPDNASTSDARNFTPRSNSVLTEVWKVVVDAHASSSLKSFEVAIVSKDPAIPSPTTGRITRGYSVGQSGSDEITMDWDTNVLTPRNGVYEIASSAVSHANNREEVSVTGLKVNNPPAPPTGVKVQVTDYVPALTWNRSTEPDLLHYVVLRSEGGGAFKEIASPDVAKYQDLQAPKETSLVYKISAVRKSPVTPTGVVGFASDPTPVVRMILPAGEATTVTSGVAPSPGKAPIELKHRGFKKTLPYEGVPARSEVAGNSASSQPAASAFLGAPSRIIQNTVRKLPYLAAGALMFVLALHVLRLARRLRTTQGEAQLT